MGTSTKNSCKTAAVVGLLRNGPAAGRDISVLPDEGQDIGALPGGRDDGRLAELAANIRAAEGRNQQLAQLMLDNAVDIGRWLTEAKAMVPHGEWGKWLEENVEYSQSKAQNLMRLYQEYGTGQESLFRGPKSQALGSLSVTKALQLLAVPDGPEREEFLEEHDVASMTTRELDAAIKERDEARKAAEQAKAERSAAEQAREKLSRDMALANERIAGLNAEVEEYSAREKEAQETAARLEKELEELKNRPVEVAVQADEAAVEAARKEAEEKMRGQLMEVNSALQRAKLEREQAETARKAAEEAQSAAQQELERVKAEAQTIREQAERTEKKAALITNEDVLLFRTLFDQIQELVNKLGGVLMKLRNKDPEKAQGLSKALLALADKIRGVATQ